MRMRSVIQMKVILASWATQHRLRSGAIRARDQQPVQYTQGIVRALPFVRKCPYVFYLLVPPFSCIRMSKECFSHWRNRYVFLLSPIGFHWQAPIVPCKRAFKYLFTDIHTYTDRGERFAAPETTALAAEYNLKLMLP